MLFLKKRQNLQTSSAANYRWRFKVNHLKGYTKTDGTSAATGLFPAILGKGPWPNWGKMIDLTSKLGEINDIEHIKGSKLYPQNPCMLDCIPFKHKCLSIILIWVMFRISSSSL